MITRGEIRDIVESIISELSISEYEMAKEGINPKEIIERHIRDVIYRIEGQREKDGWISVKTELPSAENGHIDTTVQICVRNKNKSDGIYLTDVSVFDGSSWGKRFDSWEDILYWRPMSKTPDGR